VRSLFNLTKDDIAYLRTSNIAQKYLNVKLGSITSSDITTDINAAILDPDSLPLLKYLMNILELKSRVSASGFQYVTDLNAYYENLYNQQGMGTPVSTDPTGKEKHILAYKTIIMTTDPKNNQVLLTRLSGYKGRVKFIGFACDTTVAGGFTLSFQDEDDNGLEFFQINTGAITEHLWYTSPIKDLLIWCETANKMIEVDVGGGGGASQQITFLYETWYESTP